MRTRILQITKWAAAWSLAMAVLPTTVHAQEDSTAFVANADTYLRSSGSDADVAFGDKTVFFVRNSTSAYQQLGLVRFDASSFNLPATIQLDSAKVFMHTGGQLSAVTNVHLTAVNDSYDGWDEQSITWNTYKGGALDTIGMVAITHVGDKNAQYSWDVTSHVLQELTSGNGIVTLAVFQDYNQGGNTTFISKDSATADQNKPYLVLYTHAVSVKVVNLTIDADVNGPSAALNWQTPAEANTSYAVVERSTDGVNFTEVSGHLTAQGNSGDTTDYNYTDHGPQIGYTNYYRIKYVLTDNSTYTSSVVSAAYYAQVNVLEDSYVQLANNGTNHGTETKLLVKNDGNSSYSRTAYLKFDVSGYTGAPQAAFLHLNIASANSSFASVTWYLWNVDDHSWTESTITGKNAPDLADSTQILSTEPGRKEGTVDFNIPVNVIRDAIAADGILTLAITSTNVSSTDDVSFISNDTSEVALRPVLLISADPADNTTPVSISRLSASEHAGMVTLTWKAFTELNAARFDIERSSDGQNFSVIGSVEARGTATTTKNYSYTDAAPLMGVNYYRLKAVDNDGTPGYSNIASIGTAANNAVNTWKVYPNPVHHGQQLSIELSNQTGNVTARIIDITGRVKSVQQLTGGTSTINTSNLATGVYFVQLISDKGLKIGTAQKILIK